MFNGNIHYFNGHIFNSFLYVYQRVNLHFPMVFLWFSMARPCNNPPSPVGFETHPPWPRGMIRHDCSCQFPTCQLRVVRFYVSCLLLSSSPLLLLLLNRDPRRTVFSVGPQPRPSMHSVLCRTSTTTIPAQCSLPDLNHDHPRPVFPAGPQPRPSTPSVPCRTSTASIHAKCSLPDLM